MTKFAFVIHPLDVSDVARKYTFTRYLPAPVIEALLHLIPPSEVSHITGIESITGARTEGWFVGCPLTANQLKTGDPAKAIRKIIAAGKIAQDLGAEIVGLGAFTSIVGDAGVSVAQALDIGVTTGNSFTVATALEGAVKAAEAVGHNPAECTVAVLGAGGAIGRVAAKTIGPRVARMVLNGRSRSPLERLAEEVARSAETQIETDVDAAVREADIIIAVTSAVEAVVHPEMLKPGSVVCDVARPRDVSVQVSHQRKDVLVIEGGAVAVPGDVNFNFNFGFPPGEAYACMAETMILALEGRTRDYSLGRDISVEKVDEISALAVKHGFGLAGFRSFERRVQAEDIDRVRQALAASKN